MTALAIVINHNGGGDLLRCVEALCAQTVPVEVVVVDCASTDGSRDLALSPPAGVVGVALGDNLGYTGGANAGLAAAAPDADPVGFFNPDCFAAPDLFEVCAGTFARRPDVAAVAPRLVRPGGATLDSCGQVLTRGVLRVRDRGFGAPAAGAFPTPAPVLAACGAGMVWRRRVLDEVTVDKGVFPGEYGSFWEDLELGWRANNAGWTVMYEPAATAVHRRGGSAAPGSGRMIFRRPPSVAADIVVNRWATLLRNLHAVDFLLRLPLLLAADAAMVTVVCCRRPRAVPALLRALPRLSRALARRSRLPRRRLGELP